MFRYIPVNKVFPFRILIRSLAQAKTVKTDAQRQKDKERKYKLKQEMKMKELENPIDHPLHMPIAQALNIVRSFEVGKPVDKTTIACTISVVQEQGATPLSGTVNIPFPVQRKTKPVVFTSNQSIVEELKRHNITTVGGKDLLEKFASGEISTEGFTHAFATVEMAPQLKTVARVLGPAGLQPTAKKGTIVNNVAAIMQIISSFQYKQKENHISFPVGDCSFSDAQIMANLKAVSDSIHSQIDPNANKKTRLGYCFMTTARSPGLVIDFN
ncbi:MRPL1 54S ribosomal protein L1 [Candida maltosa Xu316]|uniref:Likely mitochondrial ribosomal protein L1 n=1 Tax=Candida maltosa (strain Xu316) TaxID=1245528 RepID=M3JXN3_CANMX|nr:Likely mitochondrial ribosomal protein L1 [Candida maltosa Xu316]